MPHSETFTIADLLTSPGYRPTVLFAYQPCPQGLWSLRESSRNMFKVPAQARVLCRELHQGRDNVGVLLFARALRDAKAYWYGSRLSIEEARQYTPDTNATALQVAAGALSGMVWALNNPMRGLCEPEDLDHHAVLTVARRYLGQLDGVRCPWRPSAEFQFEDIQTSPASATAGSEETSHNLEPPRAAT